MSKTIEKEERLMLTKDQYDLLLSHYHLPLFIFITNVYFDTPNHDLLNNHIVLRIRFIKECSNIEFTLKIKGEDGDIEITQNINNQEKEMLINDRVFIDGEIKEELIKRGYNISSIKETTRLSTKRFEHQDEDTLIVIDENHYADIVDYDLEIESDSMEKSKNKILEIAKKYHLSYKNAYLSKSRRAFNSIK